MGKLNYFIVLFLIIPGFLVAQEHKTLLGHSGNVNSLSFSPDGKTLISGGSDKRIIFWNVETGNKSISISTKSNCTSVKYSTDGSNIVFSALDDGCYLYNLTNSTSTKIIDAINCYSATFSADNKYVSGTYHYETKEFYNDEKGTRVDYTLYHYISDLYSTDSKSVIEHLVIFEEEVHKISIPLFGSVSTGYRNKYFNSCFTKNSKYLIVANPNGNISVYSFETNKFLKDFKGHEDKVYYVEVSPDNNYIASASKDETVKLWNISTGKSIKTLKGHENDVNSICFSPDSKFVVTGSDDQTIKIWNVSNGNLIKTLKEFNNDVIAVSFSPDGRYIAAGGKDNKIVLWKTDNLLPELKLFTAEFDASFGIESKIENEKNLELSRIEESFRPKGEFETTDAFELRLKEKNDKIAGVNEFYKAKLEELQSNKKLEIDVLKENEQNKKEDIIQKSLRDTVFSVSNVSTYNADKQTFGVTVNRTTKNVFIPIDKAPNFKENWKKSKVKCKKQLMDDLKNYKYFDFVIIDPVTNEEIIFEDVNERK